MRAGERLRYVVVDEGVSMEPVRPISRLFGNLKHDDLTVSLQDMGDDISDESVE